MNHAPESPKLEACAECGMPCEAGEFHPYAACLMFKACHNSGTVRANLASVRPAPTASPAPVDHFPDAGKMVSPALSTREAVVRSGSFMPALQDTVVADIKMPGAMILDPMMESDRRIGEEAASRILAHVQSQSSTMAGLEEEIKELRGSLKFLVSLIDNAGLKNLVNGVQLGATSWYVKMHDAMEWARAALKPVARGE